MNPLVVFGLLIATLGFWGLSISRDAIRVLISLEVVTIGAFLLIGSAALASPTLATLLTILIVSAAAIDTVLFAAVVYRFYRYARTTDLERVGGGEGT